MKLFEIKSQGSNAGEKGGGINEELCEKEWKASRARENGVGGTPPPHPPTQWERLGCDIQMPAKSAHSRLAIYGGLCNNKVCMNSANRRTFILTVVLISPWRDQEGNKLGSMSGTRAISTTSRRELSSSFFSCKARRRRKFTPCWQKQ